MKQKKMVLTVVVLANVMTLLISMFVNGWRYESCDDYFMHSVLTGAYGGEYDFHLYFINAAYAVLLRPFYAIFPTIGWYSIMESAVVLVSFTAISYALINRCGNKLGGILALLLLTCISLEFYLHIEFTKCAAAAAATGILFFTLGGAEKRIRYLVFGCVFMVVGYIFRKEMFLLGLPTLSIMVFYTIVKEKKLWKGTAIALAVLVAVILGLKIYDSNLYKGNEYEYYAAYQPVRAFFGDGNFFDTQGFSDELDERGIGNRNYRYLRAWYFYDNNVFSLDSMNELIQIADRYRYTPNYLKMPFAVVRTISDKLGSRVWLWVLICLALIYYSNKKYWWVPWTSFALISLPYVYLLLVNRVVDHVEAGIWLYAAVFVLFFVRKESFPDEQRQGKEFYLIVLLICLSSLVFHAVTFTIGNETRRHRPQGADWGAFLQYTEKRPNDVFLLPFERYMQLAEYLGKTYKAVPPHSWDNIHSTGYWNIHLPPMNRELEKRGVTNIFRNVKKDNVYVISDKYSLSFAPFYKDHYHEMLEADTIETFGSIFLLKYHVKEVSDENASH